MEFYMRLPRNKKEFFLFLGIVSVLSVLIIAPLITMFEIGFSVNNWLMSLKGVPFIWIAVVILVLLVHGPADKLSAKLSMKQTALMLRLLLIPYVTFYSCQFS